jgi:norsolorinic acid ketoreductase
MSSNTTILITGAKSGIGKGLLTALAARPSTTVIAAIRDPDSSAAETLQNIPLGKGSRVLVAQYDASAENGADTLVANLQHQKIEALDIVIANAGILKHFGPTTEVQAADLQEHFNINTVAPILLYKSTAALLGKSKGKGKFAIISSNIGSNGLADNYNMPMLAYGISKAAVNYAVGRIHREEKDLTVLALQPGWVQTAMGEKAASFVGMDASEVPVKLDDSVAGLLNVIDAATKETHSGKFWDQTGTQMPW